MKSAIDGLIRRSWAVWADKEVRETRSMIKTVALAVSPDKALELLPRAGIRQRALIDALHRAVEPVDLRQLVADQGSTVRTALKKMEATGAVEFAEREQRDVLAEAPALGASKPPNRRRRTSGA